MKGILFASLVPSSELNEVGARFDCAECLGAVESGFHVSGGLYHFVSLVRLGEP